MSAAATTARATQRDETKVCPGAGPAVEVVEMGDDPKSEAKRDAERLLRITGNLGVAVEPQGIANRLGVQVFEGNFKEAAYGGLLMRPGRDPEIAMDRRDGLIRRRMTCAYELGHYVLRSAYTNSYRRVDLRDRVPATEETRDEVYAKEFAACLLMPEEVVKTLAELDMDDLEMAVWLVVSREAIQNRLRDLGLRTLDLKAA
ncbi:MAG: toxin [Solirubrobacterales bacterium]|nr:toxin [Solirubrobacterales bacterium]